MPLLIRYMFTLKVRQDIRSFRYDLINILKMNNMKTPNVKEDCAIGRKAKDLVKNIHQFLPKYLNNCSFILLINGFII